MEILSVAGIQVDSGRRIMREHVLQINGERVSIPLILINGREDGPRVGITAGIHGSEYVSIEAARRVGTELDPGDVRGSLIIVPIANTTAFQRRAIYTSGLDENNINRVFPGNAQGQPSEVLAHWLFEHVIRPADYYIDLHGGDMIEALVPFVLYCASPDKDVEGVAQRMALASGIPRVVRAVTHGSTYGAAAHAGIPAILAEVGGQGVWNDGLVSYQKDSASRVLRALQVLPGDIEPIEPPRLYDAFVWLRARTHGLFHPLVRVGEEVQAGQHVGDITDYFGQTIQSLDAPGTGEVIFLVTSLAMNAGDPVLAVAH